MTRRSALLLLGAGVAALVLTVPAAAGPASNRFTPGLHLTAEFPYGLVQAEPSVQVMPDTGDIFVAAPASTPIGCEVWKVSPDARSFTFRGAPDSGVGGGDCDLSAAPAASGAAEPTIAYASLTLPNLTVGNSTDGGQTWSTPNPAGSQIVGTDRQWMTTATDGTIYMSYHILETNNIAVAASRTAVSPTSTAGSPSTRCTSRSRSTTTSSGRSSRTRGRRCRPNRSTRSSPRRRRRWRT